MHLTKRYCDAATYEGKDNRRDVRWHDDPKGLGLRIYPSNEKSFVLSYSANGRKRMMTLAAYGVLTIDQASKRAKRDLAAIENNNADPLAAKRQREFELRTGTIEQTFKAYIADRKPETADDLLAVARRNIFPTFGGRGWQDVQRSEVRSWHADFDSDYVANRALQAFRAMFYWRLWRDDNNTTEVKRDTRNPCAGVPLRNEKPRQVRLELTDLSKLQSAIDAETTNVFLRALFPFILSTGCRRGEALSLQWKDVDLSDRASVIFRDTKNATDRKVPLSAHAKRELQKLPRIAKNPYVFVGQKSGTHLQSVSKCWQRIRKRAGIEHIRIHDLRRSFGSWLGDAGYSAKQIGDVLGHKSNITATVYMALGDQSRRTAVETVQTLMTNIVKSERAKS